MGWVAGAAQAIGSAAASAGSAIGSAAASAGSAAASGAAAAGSAIGEAAASAGGALGTAAQTAGTTAANAASGAEVLANAANAASTAAAENPLAQLSWAKVKQGINDTAETLLQSTSEGRAASTLFRGKFSQEAIRDAAQQYGADKLRDLGNRLNNSGGAGRILAATAGLANAGTHRTGKEEQEEQTQAAAPPQQAQGGEGQQTQQRPQVQSRNYGQFGAAPQVQGQKPFDLIDYYNSLWR